MAKVSTEFQIGQHNVTDHDIVIRMSKSLDIVCTTITSQRPTASSEVKSVLFKHINGNVMFIGTASVISDAIVYSRMIVFFFLEVHRW